MAKLHRTELPYDPIPRAVAQNAGVTLDALAVYVWARSLPDAAEVSTQAVVDLGRGMGADRATKAVRCLREHGLWHTLTFRLDGGLTSRVVVPPEPWPRHRAAAALGLDVEQLVDGPADRRHLRAITAGRADTRISDAQRADTQRSDAQRADAQISGGESLEQIKSTTPLTPRSAGGTVPGCLQEHTRPVRGCCTDRAVRERQREAARLAETEAERGRLAEVLADQLRARGDRDAGMAAVRAAMAGRGTAAP